MNIWEKLSLVKGGEIASQIHVQTTNVNKKRKKASYLYHAPLTTTYRTCSHYLSWEEFSRSCDRIRTILPFHKVIECAENPNISNRNVETFYNNVGIRNLLELILIMLCNGKNYIYLIQTSHVLSSFISKQYKPQLWKQLLMKAAAF